MTRILDNQAYAHFVEQQLSKHAAGGFVPTVSSSPLTNPQEQIKLLSPDQQEHLVLLLKVNSLETKIDGLTDLVKKLCDARFPQYVGTKEACTILGIGRTTLMDRISAGYYPFAFQDQSGRWRFNLNDLYRSIGQ